MVTDSINGLNTLIHGGEALNPHGPGRDKMYLLMASNAAWGTQSAKTYRTGYNDEDINQLKTAKKNFEAIQSALRDGQDLLPKDNFFHCNDHGFQRLSKVAEAWPSIAKGEYEDMTIEEYYRRHKNPGVKYIWRDRYTKSNGAPNFIVGQGDEELCRPDAKDDAVTVASNESPLKNIVYCPHVWGDGFIARLDGFRHTSGRVKWKDMRNRPGVFLHEMLHWRVFRPEIIDEPLTYRGHELICYKFMSCYVLANESGRDGKRRALTNADSYNVFATMVSAPNAYFTG